MIKVAIQGLRGSFHDEAAHKLLPNQDVELDAQDTFRGVFEAVLNDRTQYGVVAIENSLYGSINPVYGLLEQHDLWISGEATLQIEQYLIGCRKLDVQSLNNIETEVVSQAPALAQVEGWLNKNLPNASRREYHDTAAAVKYIVEQQRENLLAIAGKAAAKEYGGAIVAGPINDDPNNYTRFVLLGKEQIVPENANRTLIILKTDNSPGSLFKALSVFNDAGINLSKLASHPIPGDKRHYAFYIDLDAGLNTSETQASLEKLTETNNEVKILGSYRTGSKQ